MNAITHYASSRSPSRDYYRGRIMEEIAYLEARLIQIGGNGDCAYERSLSRTYRQLLEQRRRELVEITD